ncbi:hypothetical protein LNQ03_05430 [Klebsiella pneumoniae subsp. pneumoniae]|nr:hypothetical protein [Klebsiella pneumoniae subsp. pneumoniae]SSM16205.1 Uncharacterised protein [Klebsiella pneumoniae]
MLAIDRQFNVMLQLLMQTPVFQRLHILHPLSGALGATFSNKCHQENGANQVKETHGDK